MTYLATPALDVPREWPPAVDSTSALYETVDLPSHGLTPSVRSSFSTHRGLTSPEINPFAEALAVAGFLPEEMVAELTQQGDARYDKENLIRVTLLARKYVAAEFGLEAEARLRIATERVRSLLPRTTDKDFFALAESLVQINDIRKRHEEVRRSTNTPPK